MKLKPQTEEKSKGGFKERRKECLMKAKDIPTVDRLITTFIKEYELATQKKNF